MIRFNFMTLSKTVTKSLFKRPATLMYPKRPRSFPAPFRGRLVNDIDRCIFCGLCSRRCVADALVVSKGAREWQVDTMKCVICGLCVEVCPVKCLSLVNAYSPALARKADSQHVLTGPPAAKKES